MSDLQLVYRVQEVSDTLEEIGLDLRVEQETMQWEVHPRDLEAAMFVTDSILALEAWAMGYMVAAQALMSGEQPDSPETDQLREKNAQLIHALMIIVNKLSTGDPEDVAVALSAAQCHLAGVEVE